MSTSASFVNHSSNLSQLSSALCSYARLLDVSNEGKSAGESKIAAEEYLENQNQRAVQLEDVLLKATEDILPPTPEMKTATELAELCRMVQESTRNKISLLKTRMELMGVPKTWDSITSPAPMKRQPQQQQQQRKSHPQIQWSIGAPLDCVIEGDVETEGATTPGSMLQPSPFASATKGAKLLTPTTPTIDGFSFSASTKSILDKLNATQPTSSSKQRRLSRSSLSPAGTTDFAIPVDKQINFDGFKEEDDMITLATAESQDARNKKGFSKPSAMPTEARAQFLARMESVLEGLEENWNKENRPSDELSTISRKSNVGSNQSRPSNSRFLEELKEQEDEGTETSVDDDSTNVVATQVASVGEKERPVQFQTHGLETGDMVKPIPVPRRPTQIIVDNNIPSPARTNITMDNTMMNDTMITMSVLHDDFNDNDSTVTPVLDRYRLDPDDNSIGIKVVPNQRGTRGESVYPVVTETIHEFSTPAAPQYMEDKEGFLSPRGLPGSVSERKQRKFRKTPFPKKKLDSSVLSEGDENDHPNTRLAFSDSDSLARSLDSHSTKSSFSVPPLRPRSMGPARKSSRAAKAMGRAVSMPASTDLQRTPESTISSFESNLSGKHLALKRNVLMEKITRAEYEMAPQVVTMQVSHQEANTVLDAIEDYLITSKNAQGPFEFTENEAYQVLKGITETEMKAKSVLMSLCHWRRLLMYRNEDQSMLFAVNSFS